LFKLKKAYLIEEVSLRFGNMIMDVPTRLTLWQVMMKSCVNTDLCHFYFNNAILSKKQIESSKSRD
jgi:hypothetical protein